MPTSCENEDAGFLLEVGHVGSAGGLPVDEVGVGAL